MRSGSKGVTYVMIGTVPVRPVRAQRDHEQLAQAEIGVVEQALRVCRGGAQRFAVLGGDVVLLGKPGRIAKPHCGELAGRGRQRRPAFDQPAFAHKVRQARTAEEGGEQRSAPGPQHPSLGSLGPSRRDEPGHDRRVERQNLEDCPVRVFHGNDATGFGDAPELAHDAGELRFGKVLGDVGAPHAVERRLIEWELKQATDAKVHGCRARLIPDKTLDLCDVLRRQIQRDDPTRGPNLLTNERHVPTRATACVEHRPSRLDPDEAECLLVLGSGGLKVQIQSRGAAHRMAGRCRPRSAHEPTPQFRTRRSVAVSKTSRDGSGKAGPIRRSSSGEGPSWISPVFSRRLGGALELVPLGFY